MTVRSATLRADGFEFFVYQHEPEEGGPTKVVLKINGQPVENITPRWCDRGLCQIQTPAGTLGMPGCTMHNPRSWTPALKPAEANA
jgi:hypothetical protein